MNSISQDVIRLLSQASNPTAHKTTMLSFHDSQKTNDNKPILNQIRYTVRPVARWLAKSTKKTKHYH